MAYASWSVVSGEQPSASKWNILGTNDAYFNTQVGVAFSSGTTSTVWKEELGRTTLGSPASSITVSGLPARKYLEILIYTIPSGACDVSMRFNGDTGNNYSNARSVSSAGDGTSINAPSMTIHDTNAAGPHHAVIQAINVAAQEKYIWGQATCAIAGAGSFPTRVELSAKWANTAAAVSSISILTTSNNYAAGSEMVVLGHD